MIMKKSAFLKHLQGVHEDLDPALSDLFFTLQAVKNNPTTTPGVLSLESHYYRLYLKVLAIHKTLEQCHEELSELIVEEDEA